MQKSLKIEMTSMKLIAILSMRHIISANRPCNHCKALLFLFLVLLSTPDLVAQAPQYFNFQAVLKDQNNNVLQNQSVRIKISIARDSINGNDVYTEQHQISTNSRGLINLEVGRGQVLLGDFLAIQWANGPYFIRTATDPSGGNNFSLISGSQLLSVPYALFAQNGLQPGTDTNQLLYWDGTNWELLDPGNAGDILGIVNGQLTWARGPIQAGRIDSLHCQNASVSGSLNAGQSANNVTIGLPYSGGNGGLHCGQTVQSTGVTSLSATLLQDTFVQGNGLLTYSITGTPAIGGTAQFALNIGGKSCLLNLNVVDPPAQVDSFLGAQSIVIANFSAGAPAVNAYILLHYAGGNGGPYSSQNYASTGVTGLTASLSASRLNVGNGILLLQVTGTPHSAGVVNFTINFGGQTIVVSDTIGSHQGQVSSLICPVNFTQPTYNNVNVSGVTILVSYTGGNGLAYPSMSIASQGVTGLALSLSAGILANGTGSLTFTLTGMATDTGIAVFPIQIGTKSCQIQLPVSSLHLLYPAGSVFCSGNATPIVEVVNPVTGKRWMDRNLGAERVALSGTDTAGFGDLYQWGRRSDGHQCRNSGLTNVLSSTNTPAHGLFITTVSGSQQNDWRSPSNSSLWQGSTGINNPCPTGFRLPTETEWQQERITWPTNVAFPYFTNQLKLTSAGFRDNDGAIQSPSMGFYWSSTTNGTSSVFMNLSTYLTPFTQRSYAGSVRCIKN